MNPFVKKIRHDSRITNRNARTDSLRSRHNVVVRSANETEPVIREAESLCQHNTRPDFKQLQ
jgi:hypothetical protein